MGGKNKKEELCQVLTTKVILRVVAKETMKVRVLYCQLLTKILAAWLRELSLLNTNANYAEKSGEKGGEDKMSGQDDKIYCQRCGKWDWIKFKFVELPITDDETGEVLGEIKFTQYNCELCKHKWKEQK